MTDGLEPQFIPRTATEEILVAILGELQAQRRLMEAALGLLQSQPARTTRAPQRKKAAG